MSTIGAKEARLHFSGLLDRVAQGEQITITRHGVPVALLLPAETKTSQLTHAEIVEGMRALRKRVKPGPPSVREMIAQGRRR